MKCSTCNNELGKSELEQYQYIESGLDNLYLKGVDIYYCGECDVYQPIIPQIKELHRVVALAILCRTEALDGPEIKFLRKQMRYKSKDFAELLGVTPQSVSSWERKGAKHSPSHDRLIRTACLIKLCETDNKFLSLITDKAEEYLNLLAHIKGERSAERDSIQLTTDPSFIEEHYRYNYMPAFSTS